MRTASRLNSSLCIAAIFGLLDGEYCSQKTGTKPVQVHVRPGVIALLSANALYPPREIDAEGLDGEVEIIGRVVASMHEW
jgi:hypothetical protein